MKTDKKAGDVKLKISFLSLLFDGLFRERQRSSSKFVSYSIQHVYAYSQSPFIGLFTAMTELYDNHFNLLDVDECLTSPCKNGATCVNNDGGYQCQCSAGWTGDQCDKGTLRWLNTVLAVSEYRSFAKLWQEKGCSTQAETWQVKNIMMKDFD